MDFSNTPELDVNTSVNPLPPIISPFNIPRLGIHRGDDIFKRRLRRRSSRLNQNIKKHLANSFRCALMSYLSYKSPEFITEAMNNSFFMGVLGNCSLTLLHDQSSDIRMLCLKPRHVQNSYKGKSLFLQLEVLHWRCTTR